MHFNFINRLGIILILGFFYVTTPSHGDEIFLKDDFDAPPLSPIWITPNLSKNALRHITAPARTGKGAVEIRLFSGAMAQTGRDGQLTERAELREAPGVRLTMGMESWYAFSFFMPLDFPIVENRLVIVQWKQSFLESYKDRSPIVSLRYMGGKMRIDVVRDRGKRKLFNQPADLRNRWVDMIFRIKPITGKNGILQVWKDGVRIVDYRGPIGFKDDEEEIYFKFGLYRDHMKIPMRIIFDRFRRGNSFETVRFSTQ